MMGETRSEGAKIMTVTFVNLFEVPSDRDEAFLDLWTEINSHMRGQPGYVGHKLHRAMLGNARYRFVNVAIWESEQAWKAAHDERFRALVTQPAWKEFPPSPALYEVVNHGGV
jgi:heme-degrading monooxygenase HmoA